MPAPTAQTAAPKATGKPSLPPPEGSAAPKISAPKPQTNARDPHTPPPNSVPFEVIDGMVIAYGDVLLGKPLVDDFPASGYIDQPQLHLWPNGRIPYSIEEGLPNPERVLSTIKYFNENTPVRFLPFNGEPDSVVFMRGQNLCLSYVGKVGGGQPIFLEDRCDEHEIRHEIMHLLGFIHEQSRADRDQYLQIQWDNIETGKESQFVVAPAELTKPIKGRPFDYHSVMMYPPNMFARDNSKPVMVSKTGEAIEPVRTGLSPEDLERLRQLYNR